MADANWSDRRLLLHFDGSNGSTSFADSSDDARTVTAVGSAALTTSVYKWGTAALSLNGTTGNRASVSMPAFAGDFTIEAWCYLLAAGGSASRAVFTAPPFELYRNSAGSLRLYKPSSGTIIAGGTLSTDEWHHVAISRSSGIIRMFIDGTLQGSISDSTTISAGTWFIGEYAPSGGEVWQGYIDEVRVSDRAEYTAAFTAPTAAFEESGAINVYAKGESALGSGKALAAHQFIRGLGSTPLGSGQAFVAQTNLYGLGGSALGTGKSLTWNQSARIAGGSALGSGKAVAWNQYLRSLGGSALGAGKSVNNIPQTARILGGSALGSGKAVGWSDFTGAVSETSTLAYVMDLVTPDGNVRVPISSWQATLQTGASSYVQCVIPACSEWIDDIVAATEFVIYRRAELTDGSTIEYEMATSPLEVRNYSQGPFNYTATISGYPDALTAQDDPSPTFDRTLTGIRSVSDGNGGMRVRADIDWLLRPGMRAYNGDTEILVDFINYYVPGNDQYMDVGESV